MESLKKIFKLSRGKEKAPTIAPRKVGEEIVRSIVAPAGPVQIAERDPSWRIIESYYIYKPFVKIVIAETDTGPRYFVEEYGLTPTDNEVLKKLTEILIDEIRPPTRPEDIKDLKGYVFREAERIAEKYKTKLGLIGSRRIKLLYYIERNLIGYGPIDPLLRDPNIEDISCNGVGIPVYVWHKKYESIPTNITFVEEDYLNEFIMKMAHMAGKHISIAFPILDAMLPEKHRLAATFGREVSVKGPSFTIRKFRERPYSAIEIIQSGEINSLVAAYLWTLMEHGKTAMIAGGTGTGKTTLLNVVSMFIRPGMKIVTIEDTPEINLPHPNWVQLTSRESYLVGSSSVGTSIRLFDLVKLSLRYRPDYIIVGEIRGEEAFVLFQAMASVGYDTPILIRDPGGNVRIQRIGEFVDKYYSEGEERIPKPVEGHYVLSHEGYRVSWKPIRYVLRHRARRLYRIHTEDGGVIEATGNHSVFTLDPDTLEVREKPVVLLREGDLLLSFVAGHHAGVPGASISVLRAVGDDSTGSIVGNKGSMLLVKRLQDRPPDSSTDAVVAAWEARLEGSYSTVSTMRNGVRVRILPREESPWIKVPTGVFRTLIKMTGTISLPEKYFVIFREEFIPRSLALEITEWLTSNTRHGETSRSLIKRILSFIRGDLAAIKITKLEETDYRGYVYDISVPSTESFFGGPTPLLLHNTGHGGLSTIHAETLDYAIKRLTSPPMNISPPYIKLMNAFVHLKRVITRIEKGVIKVERRVTTVQEVEDFGKYVEIAHWDPKTDQFKIRFENSIHLKDIADKRGLDLEDIIDEIYRKATVLNWMLLKNITNVWDVSRIIFDYYYDPATVYKRAVEELEEAGKETITPEMAAFPETAGETEELVTGTKEMGEATKELFERTRELGR